ncbi:MAG: imidazoleglycerol-phosphate dehydratase HisB, partial [Anaerolineales bacterium]|nr:imidazoleglycerol-phosphate dehydratase HisB [Anaerolineales bacterium]
TVERKTKETNVRVTLDLDGAGDADVATSVPMLDHLLSHVAVHGLIDLEIRATGDLQIDAHHTIEDVAIVLGDALDRALGDKRGIARMGDAYVPMDDALAFVALDLSGRAYAVIDAPFVAPSIGAIPTSLVAHFLETLATHAKMNLHARVLYGRDDHHKAEALFKALGRALAQAIALDARRVGVASTKGTIWNL